jgi:hypothetical protein
MARRLKWAWYDQEKKSQNQNFRDTAPAIECDEDEGKLTPRYQR